ncbi:DNA-directed RNA polymerase sigma-70 factor [Portibacter lacus]|uniref:DNA-directed RNA polymerase sigma-70 factor n=1 Tax=Portibacter lacus TaxID=1099794 RepID=A0AA37SN27_9BACT|nr:DNA-directed RNA polymerase sigma-70 factor [Portibacter lacus]
MDIFEKHYNTLIFFGRNLGADKVLIEDCIQDLFLKFCENESLILGAHNPQAYLKSSLRRELLKKMDKKVTHLDASANVLEISVPSYEELLINQQSSLQESLSVKEALSQLSKSQKTIMTMRFYRSMSYEDIAAKLGITKRTVYNQVHDAMKKMKANFS